MCSLPQNCTDGFFSEMFKSHKSQGKSKFCARSHPSNQVPKNSCSYLTNATRLNLSKIQFQFVSKKLIRFHHYQDIKPDIV
ncbi:hypothetical protein BpHYR1_030226 [Brachionus plicatilis]|uniref:Uncharacterized protein n=1 Tax=Brachionus plicatilis TaxID=10195 RepID=A0A3M7R780_BRAPC|nr:hypothetical protein BpHYR1_030226 [Brachionus plicatilis]